jgi:hypothetical protein
MRDRQGCLAGLLELFMLNALFDWLQRQFGFGRGCSCFLPLRHLPNATSRDADCTPDGCMQLAQRKERSTKWKAILRYLLPNTLVALPHHSRTLWQSRA